MKLLKILTLVLPWPLKRFALQLFFGYRIHPSAWIGIAWFFPGKLTMAAGARIDHFVTAVHLDEVRMGEKSSIGRGTWITGFPSHSRDHFSHLTERKPRLILGDHSAITKDHHIDCTEEVSIGAFTTVAGYRSQLLTHSIDLAQSRQHAAPIRIGNYCFVGTACVMLGGAELPDYSVLGAHSLLIRAEQEPYTLYGGSPAKPIKALDRDLAYFRREKGFVA